MSRSLRSSLRRGLTLIEVAAGLALLGTLLVSLLLARSRATQQWAGANRRMQAIHVADTMLSAWWQARASIPQSASGTVAGEQRFIWRTQAQEEPTLAKWKLRLIRLEILDAATEAGPPLAIVDVVVNNETEHP